MGTTLNKINQKRRDLLKRSMAAALLMIVSPTYHFDPDSEVAWTIDSVSLETSLQREGSFDLNKTLPATVSGGGKFFIDPKGPSLPLGIELSSTGRLSTTGQDSI